jgi:hypothetical protein
MMDLDSTSRRAFVLAAGFAGFGLRAAVAGAAGSPAAPASAPATPPAPGYAADPLARDNRALVKLFTSLDGSPAPWWFAGYIYAIQLGRAPIPLVRCLGCEIYFPKRLPDGSVLARGATLTFFRDVRTGAFLDQLQNPLTGKVNEIRPNAMRSRGQSGLVYPADGSVPYVSFGEPSDTGQLNYKPPVGERKDLRGELSIELVGDRVVVTTSHGVDTPAQPWLEVSSVSGDAAALANPALPTVKASGSATYASPWMKWLQMDEVPGHLMWAVASEKLASLDALPRVYREHAEQKKLLDTLSPPRD